MRAGVCLSIFILRSNLASTVDFFPCSIFVEAMKPSRGSSTKWRVRRTVGFGRGLIAGDTAYLLSDNTDLQPVRDGENFSLCKLID